mmetsp:Transcript_36432/g.79653  ORF Transcript_36432/g.79653 Transcript_36432/m.79653 type:complete len:459 (-) Transcript_36432:109-1485(-)
MAASTRKTNRDETPEGESQQSDRPVQRGSNERDSGNPAEQVFDRAEESADKNAAESNTSSPTGGKKKKKKTTPLRTQDKNQRKRKGTSDDNEDDACGDLKEAKNEVKKARRAEAAAKAKLEAAQKENAKKELKLREKTDQVSSLRRTNTYLEKKVNAQQAKIVDAATKNGKIAAEKSGTDLELRELQTRYQQLVRKSKGLQKKADAAEKRNDDLEAKMAQHIVEYNRLKMEDNEKKYEHEVRIKKLEIEAKNVDKSRAVEVAEKTSSARMYERMSKDERNKVNNEMKEKLMKDKADREKERRETYNARVMQATSSMTGATVLSDEYRRLRELRGGHGSHHGHHKSRHSHHCDHHGRHNHDGYRGHHGHSHHGHSHHNDGHRNHHRNDRHDRHGRHYRRHHHTDALPYSTYYDNSDTEDVQWEHTRALNLRPHLAIPDSNGMVECEEKDASSRDSEMGC